MEADGSHLKSDQRLIGILMFSSFLLNYLFLCKDSQSIHRLLSVTFKQIWMHHTWASYIASLSDAVCVLACCVVINYWSILTKLIPPPPPPLPFPPIEKQISRGRALKDLDPCGFSEWTYCMQVMPGKKRIYMDDSWRRISWDVFTLSTGFFCAVGLLSQQGIQGMQGVL